MNLAIFDVEGGLREQAGRALTRYCEALPTNNPPLLPNCADAEEDLLG
jgi:hypothetical protein